VGGGIEAVAVYGMTGDGAGAKQGMSLGELIVQCTKTGSGGRGRVSRSRITRPCLHFERQ